MKSLRRRIASVRNTRQIIRAMNLVASSKFQALRLRLEAARAMADGAGRVIDSVKRSPAMRDSRFVRPREVQNAAYVVITGDRGLCGGYNVNAARAAFDEINARGSGKIIAVGHKGYEFFKQRNMDILRKYDGVSETALYEDAETIGALLADYYITGAADEAFVVYTRFKSTLNHVPGKIKLLPFGGDDGGGYEPMRYEPDAAEFAEHAARLYLNAALYGALVESAVCEQAARMLSMDAASSSASDIIDGLTLRFNRERQGLITQEINEIVSASI